MGKRMSCRVMARCSAGQVALAAVVLTTQAAASPATSRIELNADVGLALGVGGIDAHAADWAAVRRDIREAFKSNPGYDDGSLAPIVLRLAWHSAALYDPNEIPHGGTYGGATMRFDPERSYEDNQGLSIARDAMNEVITKHPLASVADVWVLAGYVAVEELGGPYIEFTPGRTDAIRGGDLCPPESRFPLWNDKAATLREKFGRMGLSDRDIVALSGAHSVGHSHEDHSGFPYHQWDNSPLKFDNTYYDFLMANWWVYDDDNPERPYYRNRSWLMLLSDFELREDNEFRDIVEEYRADERRWHNDFAIAFKKVTELGMETHP